VHTETAETLEEAVQHVHRRPGVGQCPMARFGAGAEERGQGGEPAVRRLVPGEHATGQARGVDRGEPRPRQGEALCSGPQETQVEGGVVGDEHRAPGEVEKGR